MIVSIRKLLLLCALTVPTTGFAGLIGQEFEVSYQFPNLGVPYSQGSFSPAMFTVGLGQESTGNVEDVTFLNIDFSDDALTIVLDTVLSTPTWSAASFNGLVFQASLPHGIISALVNGAATTMSGFDDSRVSFVEDQILINWQGLSYVDGTTVTVDFGFAAQPVPLPESIWLLVPGLLSLCFTQRRKLFKGLEVYKTI